MNQDETRSAAAVMLAWTEGARIEFRNRELALGEDRWIALPPGPPSWNWGLFEYRIRQQQAA